MFVCLFLLLLLQLTLTKDFLVGFLLTSRRLSLCEVSETLTKWKSESMTYLPTYGLTREGGARNTCVSKIEEKIARTFQSYQTKMTLFDQCALCLMFMGPFTYDVSRRRGGKGGTFQ